MGCLFLTANQTVNQILGEIQLKQSERWRYGFSLGSISAN